MLEDPDIKRGGVQTSNRYSKPIKKPSRIEQMLPRTMCNFVLARMDKSSSISESIFR